MLSRVSLVYIFLFLFFSMFNSFLYAGTIYFYIKMKKEFSTLQIFQIRQIIESTSLSILYYQKRI